MRISFLIPTYNERATLRVYQLPIISYDGRIYEEGKKITWRDGFKAIWVLIRVRIVD